MLKWIVYRSRYMVYMAQKEMNKRKRVIGKGGTTNVTYKNISKKKRKYFLDLYTTLLGRVKHGLQVYTTLLGRVKHDYRFTPHF